MSDGIKNKNKNKATCRGNGKIFGVEDGDLVVWISEHVRSTKTNFIEWIYHTVNEILNLDGVQSYTWSVYKVSTLSLNPPELCYYLTHWGDIIDGMNTPKYPSHSN